MADRFAVPQNCLVAVPDTVKDDAAVFAEPLAAALHVLDDVPDDDAPIVVLGDGKLGQLVARALLGSVAARSSSTSREQLALARRRRAVLESELAGDLDGSPIVVEATGRAAGIASARLRSARGTVVLKTRRARATTVDLRRSSFTSSRSRASRCGDLARAVRILAGSPGGPDAADRRALLARASGRRVRPRRRTGCVEGARRSPRGLGDTP
jgi:threonine dehydrogenase-like Zn-dependent dehydrogenase